MICQKSIVFIFICILCCQAKECKVADDCLISNSICESGKCVCRKDFVTSSDKTQCLPIADGFGDNCTDSVQCSAMLITGGHCLNNTCGCAQGYHYLRGRCWKTSGLDDTCQSNENCYINYDFEASVCKNKICVCSPGYYQREYSSCRRMSFEPGDPCGIFLDCRYNNSICRKNRTCGFNNETEDHYIPDHSASPSVNSISTRISEKCATDSDCKNIFNSICHGGYCLCKAGYFVNDSKCYPEIGSPCSSDNDCIGKYMMCREKEKWCTCKEGFVAEDGNRDCTKMSRNISWSCLEDRWCSFFGPGGVCVDKKCECSKNTHFITDLLYCWITKDVGSNCKVTQDCGGNSIIESCNSGACTCAVGHHPSSDNHTCHTNGLKVGDPCSENLDCMFGHSECNTTQEKCVCSRGYMVNNKVCASGVGGVCNNVTKCLAAGSVCNNSLCACPDKFVSSSDYSKCLPVATNYSNPCFESQQCSQLLGVGGICQKNTCVCSKGYHNFNSYCYENIPLYGICSYTPQCQVDNDFSECRNGFCLCKYGHQPDAFNSTCTNVSTRISASIVYVFIMLSLILYNLSNTYL